jgi:hypothetical protein
MIFDTLFRPFVPFAPSPLAELLDDVTVVEDIEPLKPLVLMRILPMAAAKFNSSSVKPLRRKARLGRSYRIISKKQHYQIMLHCSRV